MLALFQGRISFGVFKHWENSVGNFSITMSFPSFLRTTVISTSSGVFPVLMPFRAFPTPCLVSSVTSQAGLVLSTVCLI